MEDAHRRLSFGMVTDDGVRPLSETRRERLADRVHDLGCRLSRLEGAHWWFSPWTPPCYGLGLPSERPAEGLADRVHDLDRRLSRLEVAHADSPCCPLLAAPGPERPPSA